MPTTHRRRPRAVRRWVTGLLVALVLLVAASVTGVLPVQVVRVSSASMSPTIHDGDLVLVEHGADVFRRRDVVAARSPVTGEQLIKRVVAVGGDRVAIQEGVLMVNGTAACEPSIDPEGMDGAWSGTTVVPSGSLFLMGDERDLSIDSRDFGPVAEDEVSGLVRTRVWPSPGSIPVDRC
jgi:signal peptidase I